MSSITLYSELTDGIGKDLQTFCDSLNKQTQRIVDMLNDAASGIGGFFGSIFGNIEEAIDKWNNEISPAITKMWGELQTNIWDAVGDLAGRPTALIDYAKAFTDVKAKIYKAGDLTQKLVIFEHDWQGYAATNYKTVATSQDAGLRDLSLAMDAGSTLTSNAANQILTLWRKLAKEFLGWTADLIGCFEKATEADSVISFEIPAMFDAAQGVWQAIIDIADVLVEFLIDQATTASTSWRQLANGARGLPQNIWPAIEEANSDVMNDPGNWTPK